MLFQHSSSVCALIITVITLPAFADDVSDFLAKPRAPEPSWFNEANRLIERHPGHADILTLRLAYLGQKLGTSTKREHLDSMINDLDALDKEGLAAGKPAVSFDALVLKGNIQYNSLSDYAAAYKTYKSLEHHDRLKQDDAGLDYSRTSLFLQIAQAAQAAGNSAEAEKYSRLVMAYPHLGMDDRVAYQKFYDLYEAAGVVYLNAVANDYKKLVDVDIYPSHPRLVNARSQLTKKWVKDQSVT
jgi:hypothetical protein